MKYSIGILIGFFLLGLTTISNAQKIALVDIAYVLDNMDEYKQAQEELDKVAQAWQQEIAVEQDKIKSMYNKYQAEVVLLSDEMKKQKEDEIMAAERDVRNMQKDKFGPEGELFQKRQALVSPIQEKVYGVIQQYATDRGYDIIIDKGGNSGILFSDERFDKTEDILRALKN
ncbi:MAG: OmpH family outer membrane protein [Saprospiraceae bacterium]|nr:OmpH family outer membrane protein [Saprospiraceae bacterium]